MFKSNHKIPNMKCLPVVALFLILHVCGHSQTAKKPDWVSWKNKAGTISMNHPRDWILWDYGSGEIVSFVTSKDNENDQFPDGISLRSFPNSANNTLEDFEKKSIKALGGKVKSSQKLTFGNREYLKTTIEMEAEKTSMIMYAFLKNNQVYFLQLIIETRNWSRYSWVGDEAFKSLVIK
jgi:hypothetical protein